MILGQEGEDMTGKGRRGSLFESQCVVDVVVVQLSRTRPSSSRHPSFVVLLPQITKYFCFHMHLCCSFSFFVGPCCLIVSPLFVFFSSFFFHLLPMSIQFSTIWTSRWHNIHLSLCRTPLHFSTILTTSVGGGCFLVIYKNMEYVVIEVRASGDS